MIKKIILKFGLGKIEYYFYKIFTSYYINSGIKIDISSYENFQRAKSLKVKETDTIEWIESFNKNDIFYDIGANIGVYSLYASSRCKEVLSFEPHFMNYNVLNKNIYLNKFKNTRAFCLAFSNKMEIGKLEHFKFSIGSSTSQFNKTTDHNGKEFNSKFSQGMISLSVDDFTNNIDDELFPNHIKIDVDGLEELILNGMTNVLRNSKLKSVLVEITNDEQIIKNALNKCDLFLINKQDTSTNTANYIFKRN